MRQILLLLLMVSCTNLTQRKNEDSNIISKMKVDSLVYGKDFSIEIDFHDKRVKKFKPNKFKEYQYELPESFSAFINEITDGLVINIGNELTIFPADSVAGIWTDILTMTKEFRDSVIKNDKFIIFGMNGVDSETWAFYTGKKFKNGEFPIVWISPGGLNNSYFVLMNSRFDRFLTIQYYLLKSGDYEEEMSYDEANKNSNDKDYMNKIETKQQQLIDSLYKKYDPMIPIPRPDFYQQTMTLEQLDKLIDKINNNAI